MASQVAVAPRSSFSLPQLADSGVESALDPDRVAWRIGHGEGEFFAVPEGSGGGEVFFAMLRMGRRGDTSPVEDASYKQTDAQNLIFRS